jgi:hypothetical protein
MEGGTTSQKKKKALTAVQKGEVLKFSKGR